MLFPSRHRHITNDDVVAVVPREVLHVGDLQERLGHRVFDKFGVFLSVDDRALSAFKKLAAFLARIGLKQRRRVGVNGKYLGTIRVD